MNVRGPAARRGVVLVLLLGLVTACGDGDDEATTAGAEAGASTVAVALAEYSVTADPAEAAAGNVTFEVANEGTIVHEFVVVETDLAPDELPTDEAGDVVESGEGMDVVVEIEDLPAGEGDDLTIDLASGDYVLICNVPTHYGLGMRTAFTVT